MNSETYTQFVNRTSRRAGAVGKSPLCYQWARKLLTDGIKEWQPGRTHTLPKDTAQILDFGCGKGAPHTQRMGEEGYHILGWDIGPNNPGISIPPPNRAYDLVILSNVLNVQPTAEDLTRVLSEAYQHVKPLGYLICNYPRQPRHNWVSDNKLQELVHKLSSDYIAPGKNIYLVRRPFEDFH